MKSCGIGCADHLKICRAATQQFFIFKFSFLIFSSRWRGCVGPFRSSKAPSPFPSPSGGGCRPQGRQERENATGPRRGNDRSGGGARTNRASSSGQVLPLPSSASRGIGGCHLPPLGEGNGACGFAGGLLKTRCCCAVRRPRRALLRNSRSPIRSICHCKGRPSGKAGAASPAMVYKYARRSSASLASRRISLAAVSRLGPSAAAYWFR